ncbi:MAG TPA: T9SS type A sorting domain-containing protein, partial [Flavobacterium sp.]|nr:T9SS type A sorting domain-containing protein [Flavobacterium sp.]
IFNHKNIYVQQAPMPFITERTGDFATAVNSPINDIRGLDIFENDYSIVKVKHNISEPSNSVDLGMFVDSGIQIIINNDNKLQNDWYLKLDGKIDLVGKSQLVQTIESDLDVTSSGSLERDQQGQSNIFNYNYWSSPVSPINTTSNNTNYSINGVMRDGSNPASPSNINWINGYDGAPTSPISLATFWLYKFDNYGNDYFSWVAISPTDPLRVGQAFTMKGSGALALQNYVFTGKPNNGLVNTNVVSSDQLMLTGNPYPSALDATAFINDNLATNTIDGTLYFWEHYPTNLTHDLRDYQGGYAERNLVGGLPPAAPELISNLGSSIRIPGQFVPVGQGFFVNGKIGGGGTITYNNNQRGFHKENELGVSNSMFKTAAKTKKPVISSNNSNDPIVKDEFKRIRLGFTSHNKYHRQVLLGFMDQNATSDIDYGYDGLNMDDFPNDMYFLNGENQLVIQGEGFFKEDASYPLGVKTDAEGKVTFMIDDLENFDKNQKIFIYDSERKTYHNLTKQPFEILLPTGIFDGRFTLCFKDKKQKHKDDDEGEDEDDKKSIKTKFIQSNRTLKIANTSTDSTVNTVSLFNILGQFITQWDVMDQNQANIQIPILNISSGIYITKLSTSNGELSHKIIIP